MKKRFIYDLDGTLLHGDFSKEQEYFRSILSKTDAEIFLSRLCELLEKYEKNFIRYEISILSEFLTKESNINITDDMIEGWLITNSNMDDIMLQETKEMLEYLKSKNYSLVVLTNWFAKTQISRLKNAGILQYFDDVFGGDSFLKPSKESFMLAKGNYDIKDCVMIGDTISKDVLGPNIIGMDSVYYNPKSLVYDIKVINSINSFNEIKERY